jgi:tetratricopeptide (TPR) repeat protein
MMHFKGYLTASSRTASAVAYQKLFEYELAIMNLELARIHDSKNLRVLFSLTECYKSTQRIDGAIEIYMEIINIHSPDNIIALGRLGKILIENKQYLQASDVYLKLVKLKTDNSYFFEQLGKCYLNLDKTDKAISNFEIAISMNPHSVNPYIHLSNTYIRKNQVDSALIMINNGLIFNPENKLLLRAKAERLFDKKIYGDAITIYKNLILSGDSTATIFRKTGMNYYHWGDIPVALDYLERSFNKDSTDAYTHFYLGLTYKKFGKYSVAIYWLNKAVTTFLPLIMPDVYMMLAYSYDKNRDYKNAIQVYKFLYNFYPNRKEALFYLASIYDRYYADPNVALEYYHKYLNEVSDPSKEFREYSEERIKILKEKKHF